MKSYSNPAWQIEYQCPQCGAPVTLQEADRLFTCPYCRVRLYITADGPFRYFLPPKKSFSGKIFFFPYWRFRGIAFSCIPYEIRQRIIDSSILAFHDRSLPPSLGLRPQVLKLKMVSSETTGTFLKPAFSFHEGILRIEKQLEAVGGDGIRVSSLFKTFIGGGISLIYSPLFIENGGYHDAIVGSLVAPIRESAVDQFSLSDPHEGWQVSFISTLCPDCGNDLQGESDSIILLCKSCHAAWKPSPARLERSEFAVIQAGEGDLFYLPFWRMKASIDGISMNSYADLVRLANLPKAMKKEWEELDCYLWSPAFKINPLLFLRLSKQMTLSLPPEELVKEIPEAPLHPVTLSSTEAAESIRVNVANLSVEKRRIFPELASKEIRLKESLLVYVPLVQKGNELTHPRLGFSLQRNALKMGIYL